MSQIKVELKKDLPLLGDFPWLETRSFTYIEKPDARIGRFKKKHGVEITG